MGAGRRTRKILKRILKEYQKTVVIDADGLNAVAGSRKLQKLVRETGARVIITPHIGEAKRLLGNSRLMGLTKLVVPNTSVCPGWGNVTITPATTTTTTPAA